VSRSFVPRLLLPLALGALAAHAAAGALYKWTDATGRVVYSDQPPTGDVKYEKVGAPPPPANPNAGKELAGKEAEFKKRQLDQAEAEAKASKADAEAARLRNFCLSVRGQIIGLGQPNVSMYRINDKGERVPMDPAERKAEIEKLERTMKDRNCPAT
jgi:hypothetical protein